MHRQAPAVLVVGKIKELLEYLRVQNGYDKVKTRIVIGQNSEQGNFLFSQRGQVKLIGGGQSRKAFQIEFFKPCGKGYLNALTVPALWIWQACSFQGSYTYRSGFPPEHHAWS